MSLEYICTCLLALIYAFSYYRSQTSIKTKDDVICRFNRHLLYIFDTLQFGNQHQFSLGEIPLTYESATDRHVIG